ncbi:MAG: ATP-binding protein [Pseudoxanthomonas sp.]
MARTRKLSRLLVLSHVSLAVLLCALLLATGAGTLRAALRERAQAQVTQAGADSLARLEDFRRDIAVVAVLLSERPTLHNYLQRGQARAAADFLETFRQTGRVDYLLAMREDGVFAQVGQAPPETERSGLIVDSKGAYWLVQVQAMARMDHTRVIAARRLQPEELAGHGSRSDRVQLLGDDFAGGDLSDADALALQASYQHVKSTGIGETLPADSKGNVVRLDPIRGPDGDIEALLMVSLSREAVARDGVRWLSAFAIGSLVLAIAAAIVAVWLARRIASPFGQVARAAERLGVGDLESPVVVPVTDLVEPVALARSLDSMRLQLRASTERERRHRLELDAILDGVEDGIIAVGADRSIQYANRQFLALVGRSEADVIGQPYDAVLTPEPAESRPANAADPMGDARRHGLAQASGRYLLRGRLRNLVIRSSAPPGGRQVAIVREETSAEAARAMRDSILANLSHEFQTPLAAQIASVEMLREHVHASGDATSIKLVDSQYRGALRLSQLVDNLLDSVRLESGEMRLRREVVDLPALVRDAVDLMRPLTDQRDQHVMASLPHSDRRLMGDAQRLSQVAINLLANANKFAPDQSTIWIELVWGEETVSLWVEDEGQGLPPLRHRADLFAPFRRSPDQEPSQRGTGLGLAIVRALVEQHGGEVVLAEPRHRRGARFGVVLPMEPA